MQIPEVFQPDCQSFIQALTVRGYSPRTIASHQLSLSIFLNYLLSSGIADILEVAHSTIRGYQLWLQQEGYAGWTIVLRIQSVRRFFEHLERTQKILLNPCTGTGPCKTPCRLPKTVLSVEDARKVLETPDLSTAIGLRDRAILEVFYSSGIRLEEMARLTVDDVDCNSGFVRVNQGKGGKDRVVPLGHGACECVRRYISEARSKWIDARKQKALWLSSRPPHEPIKSQIIEVMVRRWGKAAGLTQRLTPHVWRHTCASQLVASGASIVYVQRLLGHASLRTTQVYVRTTIPEIVEMHSRLHPRNQQGVA